MTPLLSCHSRVWSRVFFLLGMLVMLCIQDARAVSFTFTLAKSSKTSAGVYAADGTLVKTLWSGVTYEAGKHAAEWDGTDDDGHLAANGTYQVRVLTSDCKYTWEGVVGNTSEKWSGDTVHHYMNTISGMAITGTTVYLACNYNEGLPSQARVTTTNPQAKTWIVGKAATFTRVVTDGTTVYWAGDDSNVKDESFVMGTVVGTDAQKTFQFGKPFSAKYAYVKYTSVINHITDTPGAEISGLAVQRVKPYLFVAHKGMNALRVLNKTTGQLVKSLTYTAPGEIAVDGNDNLWMIHTVNEARGVQHFAVNEDGTLTAGQLITSFSDPLALADNGKGMLLVADGGDSQQVKAFTQDGKPLWTLGQAGGYAKDPLVANDKFEFSTPYAYNVGVTYLAFQPDGTFWVGDPGCYRNQHFSAARAFIDNIAYVPTLYGVGVDPNKPTRVFANYLEYAINYDLPLGPANGSWTLKRNWGPGVPAGYNSNFVRIKYPTTLANGRTYAFLDYSKTYSYAIFELQSAGHLRNTGITVPWDTTLQPDGTLRSLRRPTKGISTWTERALTGFDDKNNPIWAEPTVLATAPAGDTDPVYWGNNPLLRAPKTTGDIVVSFDANSSNHRNNGWHLGGVRAGTNTWLWKASPSTATHYTGPWPTDGTFNLGQVLLAGGVSLAVDRHIFYNYYGEGYKGGQTNKYRHYYEDGLYIGEFGTWITAPAAATPEGEAKAEMAGNGFSAWIVKLPDGRGYIYHNDESMHGGVHRWRIDGLDTVAAQTVPVTWQREAQTGLQAEFFASADWNNRYRIKTRRDAQVNFDWKEGVPPDAGLTDGDNFSVRWSGFVTPQFNETYTFKTVTEDRACVWVNGRQVLAGDGPQTGTIALTAGINYPITVEYKDTTGPASIALKWSSASLPEEVIPSSRLILSVQPVPAAVANLLEGLPPNSAAVPNGAYGWSYTEGHLSVQTNGKTWDRTSPVDLDTYFHTTGARVTANLTRDLGPVSDAVTQWELAANINFEGSYVNHSESSQGGSGGQYLEVLDDAGKVIARFYAKMLAWPTDGRVYGNNAVLLQERADTLQNTILAQWQPLSITAKDGQITFQYAAGKSQTTGLFDPNANWRHAKTLQLYYWVNGSGYRRTCYLDDLTFRVFPQPPIANSDGQRS